jgi:hypothetical protein
VLRVISGLVVFVSAILFLLTSSLFALVAAGVAFFVFIYALVIKKSARISGEL